MGRRRGRRISLGEETRRVGEGEGRTRRGRGVEVGSTRVARLPGARVPGARVPGARVPGARPVGRGDGMMVTGAAAETCGVCKIVWLV